MKLTTNIFDWTADTININWSTTIHLESTLLHNTGCMILDTVAQVTGVIWVTGDLHSIHVELSINVTTSRIGWHRKICKICAVHFIFFMGNHWWWQRSACPYIHRNWKEVGQIIYLILMQKMAINFAQAKKWQKLYFVDLVSLIYSWHSTGIKFVCKISLFLFGTIKLRKSQKRQNMLAWMKDVCCEAHFLGWLPWHTGFTGSHQLRCGSGSLVVGCWQSDPWTPNIITWLQEPSLLTLNIFH